MNAPSTDGSWLRVPIHHIEDLKDAVYGAGLRATQMSRAPVSGSLLFRELDGVAYSSGHVRARVSLTGPLSESKVTFGIGVTLAPGTRHWLREVDSGDFGLFMGGDEHDALYYPGSVYAAVTMTDERAEEIAAQMGRVLDVRQLGGSGVSRRGLAGPALLSLQRRLLELHSDVRTNADDIHQALLRHVIGHFGRLPRPQIGPAEYRGYSRIARHAREHIVEHLSQPFCIESIAAAVGTSPRTLFRAFSVVMGETPLVYIRRLRLHGIRHELLADQNSSIAQIAERYGIGEPGRLSGWYRQLFGELPSQTRPRPS